MEVERVLSLEEAEQETVRRAGERDRRGLAAKAVEVAMEAVRPAIAAAAASVARAGRGVWTERSLIRDRSIDGGRLVCVREGDKERGGSG
jgi:hypothetical protein